MQEVLFRGKIKGLTDWQYGYYAKSGDNHYILLDTDSEDNFSIVDGDTVGQYTGLIDNNGKEIFEGDIISQQLSLQVYRLCKVIKYDGSYWIKPLSNGRWERRSRLNTNNIKFCKVFGNIHDNPELLEDGI